MFLVFVNGFQSEHFHPAQASRDRDANLVAGLLAEQAAPNGRRSGDHALGDVSVLAGHQLIRDLLILLEIKDGERGSQPSAVGGNLRKVDHGEFAHSLAQLSDPRIHKGLAFLGGVKLGVFLEIAMRARLQDLLGQLIAQLVFERVDLVLQLLDQVHLQFF
jgi:hypothetical protein